MRSTSVRSVSRRGLISAFRFRQVGAVTLPAVGVGPASPRPRHGFAVLRQPLRSFIDLRAHPPRGTERPGLREWTSPRQKRPPSHGRASGTTRANGKAFFEPRHEEPLRLALRAGKTQSPLG